MVLRTLLERKARVRFLSCRLAARKRGLVFCIEEEEFYRLALSPCFYCGKEADEERVNGLDRVDNALGYLSTNVVSACAYCNHMKSDSSSASFIGHCEQVVFHEFSKRSIEEQAYFLRLIQKYGSTKRK